MSCRRNQITVAAVQERSSLGRSFVLVARDQGFLFEAMHGDCGEHAIKQRCDGVKAFVVTKVCPFSHARISARTLSFLGVDPSRPARPTLWSHQKAWGRQVWRRDGFVVHGSCVDDRVR